MAQTATDLARASLEAVKAGQREQWLDLFDEHSVVEDPVGPSPADPEGKGYHGRDAIAAFYDSGIGDLKTFDYEITRVCRCGDEAAVLVSFKITTPDDQLLEFDAMNIYIRGSNGKLAALRSFHHGATD
jgi:ketosteroid isomerase-like protein